MLENTLNERDLDFSAIGKAIQRRKKILLVSSSIALAGSIVFSSIQRIFFPIYSGSFTFLVNNPLEASAGGSATKALDGATRGGYFNSFLKSK